MGTELGPSQEMMKSKQCHQGLLGEFGSVLKALAFETVGCTELGTLLRNRFHVEPVAQNNWCCS